MLLRPVSSFERSSPLTSREVYRICSTLETVIEEGWIGDLQVSLITVIKLRKFGLTTNLRVTKTGYNIIETNSFIVDPYPRIYGLKSGDVLIEPKDSCNPYYEDSEIVDYDTEQLIVDMLISDRTSCAECGAPSQNKLCGYCITKLFLEGDYKLPEIWRLKRDELELEVRHYEKRTSA